MEQGFTLMEIMIVVAILGLLAGVVVMNVGGAREKAKESTSRTSMASIDSALEMFKLDWGQYPFEASGGGDEWSDVADILTTTNIETLKELLINMGAVDQNVSNDALKSQFTGPYLKKGKRGLVDGWSREFLFKTEDLETGGAGYKMWSKGKNNIDDSDDEEGGDDIISEGSSPGIQ